MSSRIVIMIIAWLAGVAACTPPTTPPLPSPPPVPMPNPGRPFVPKTAPADPGGKSDVPAPAAEEERANGAPIDGGRPLEPLPPDIVPQRTRGAQQRLPPGVAQ